MAQLSPRSASNLVKSRFPSVRQEEDPDEHEPMWLDLRTQVSFRTGQQKQKHACMERSNSEGSSADKKPASEDRFLAHARKITTRPGHSAFRLRASSAPEAVSGSPTTMLLLPSVEDGPALARQELLRAKKKKKKAKTMARMAAISRLTRSRHQVAKTPARPSTTKNGKTNNPKMSELVHSQLSKMLQQREKKTRRRKEQRQRRVKATKARRHLDLQQRENYRKKAAAAASRMHAQNVKKQRTSQARAKALAAKLSAVDAARANRERKKRDEALSRMAHSQERSEKVRQNIAKKQEQWVMAQAAATEDKKRRIAGLREQERAASLDLFKKSQDRVASRIAALAKSRKAERKRRQKQAAMKEQVIEENQRQLRSEENEWKKGLADALNAKFTRVDQLFAMRQAMLDDTTFWARLERVRKQKDDEAAEKQIRRWQLSARALATQDGDASSTGEQSFPVSFQKSTWSQADRMSPQAESASSPGPGEYPTQSYSSLNTTGGVMSRGTRRSIIDEAAERAASTPGAGAYDMADDISKGDGTNIEGAVGFGSTSRRENLRSSTHEDESNAASFAQANAQSLARRRQSVVMVQSAADKLRQERVHGHVTVFASKMRRRFSILQLATMDAEQEQEEQDLERGKGKEKAGAEMADIVLSVKRRQLSDKLIAQARRRAAKMLLTQINAASDMEAGTSTGTAGETKTVAEELKVAHRNSLHLVQQEMKRYSTSISKKEESTITGDDKDQEGQSRSQAEDIDANISNLVKALPPSQSRSSVGTGKRRSKVGGGEGAVITKGRGKKHRNEAVQRRATEAVRTTINRQIEEKAKEAWPAPLLASLDSTDKQTNAVGYNVYAFDDKQEDGDQAVAATEGEGGGSCVACESRWEEMDVAEAALEKYIGIKRLLEFRAAHQRLRAEEDAATKAQQKQLQTLHRNDRADFLRLTAAQDMIVAAQDAREKGDNDEEKRLLQEALEIHRRLLGEDHMDTMWVRAHL